MKELAAHEYIVGTKDATCNIAQIVEIAQLCRGFDIYSGNDDHVIPIMSVGGLGVISVVSNVAPRMTHDMAMAFLEGDVVRARELQFKLNPLVKTLFCEVNPTPIKMALNMIGIRAGIPRLPLTEMCAEKAVCLKRELIALGFEIA
jgi:4-hydroxy-tetrahydrodipicolinate synthase